VKLIVVKKGLSNCTLTVADWPGARLATPPTMGIVRYGDPEKSPVAFASVTPAVSPVKTIWKGPLIAPLLMFVMVTVPLKVRVTRL
jgi:hypothetical protein